MWRKSDLINVSVMILPTDLHKAAAWCQEDKQRKRMEKVLAAACTKWPWSKRFMCDCLLQHIPGEKQCQKWLRESEKSNVRRCRTIPTMCKPLSLSSLIKRALDVAVVSVGTFYLLLYVPELGRNLPHVCTPLHIFLLHCCCPSIWRWCSSPRPCLCLRLLSRSLLLLGLAVVWFQMNPSGWLHRLGVPLLLRKWDR